jgi:hypothetical protein
MSDSQTTVGAASNTMTTSGGSERLVDDDGTNIKLEETSTCPVLPADMPATLEHATSESLHNETCEALK